MTPAAPEPRDSRPAQHTLDGRTSEQVAMERSAQKVSDVLLNLEHAIAAAKKALKVGRRTVSTPTRSSPSAP